MHTGLHFHLFAVVPELVRIAVLEDSPLPARRAAVQTLSHIAQLHDLSDHSSRMVHPLARMLATPEPYPTGPASDQPLHLDVLFLMCQLMYQLGPGFCCFEPMLHRAVAPRRSRLAAGAARGSLWPGGTDVSAGSDPQVAVVACFTRMTEILAGNHTPAAMQLEFDTLLRAEFPRLPPLCSLQQPAPAATQLDSQMEQVPSHAAPRPRPHACGVQDGDGGLVHAAVAFDKLKSGWNTTLQSTREGWSEWLHTFSNVLLAVRIRSPPVCRRRAGVTLACASVVLHPRQVLHAPCQQALPSRLREPASHRCRLVMHSYSCRVGPSWTMSTRSGLRPCIGALTRPDPP